MLHAASNVYRRTYQPHGWGERVLLLTYALAEAGAQPPSDDASLTGPGSAAAAAAARGGGWLARMMSRICKEALGELVAAAEAALQVPWQTLGWKGLSDEVTAAALERLRIAVGALVAAAGYRFGWGSHSIATVEGFLWRVLEQLGEGPKSVASYSAIDIETMEPRELEGYTAVLAAAATCTQALNTPDRLSLDQRREFAAFTLRKKVRTSRQNLPQPNRRCWSSRGIDQFRLYEVYVLGTQVAPVTHACIAALAQRSASASVAGADMHRAPTPAAPLTLREGGTHGRSRSRWRRPW